MLLRVSNTVAGGADPDTIDFSYDRVNVGTFHDDTAGAPERKPGKKSSPR